MILVLHVVVALLGMLSATIAALFPSRSKLYLSHSLVLLTVVSGVYLIVAKHAPMLQTCVSGLTYVFVTQAVLAVALWRLKRVPVPTFK
jgi:hypothetical protein